MLIQLTPGQKCILGILQKKLIGTLEEYAIAYQERECNIEILGEGNSNHALYHSEVVRLRAKIKRILGRQKRFTSEILNQNGINTIPKESYLKALGLITKEALQQIQTKKSGRRLRTTTNSRFSRSAMQTRKELTRIAEETGIDLDNLHQFISS